MRPSADIVKVYLYVVPASHTVRGIDASWICCTFLVEPPFVENSIEKHTSCVSCCGNTIISERREAVLVASTGTSIPSVEISESA